jgi:hypothetical protein
MRQILTKDLNACPSVEDFVSAADLAMVGLMNLSIIGGLMTTEGIKDLSHIGGVCLAQQTLTTKGLKDLPLVGGLYLAQRTSNSEQNN